MNFGEIRNTFSNVMVEGMLTKNPDLINAFNKYIKTLKENKELSSIGMIYHNIENESVVNPSEAQIFVEMNMGLLGDLDKIKLTEGINELSGILASIKLPDSNYSADDIKLHESIVIATNRKVNTIKESIAASSYLVDRVMTNNPIAAISENMVAPEALSKLAVDKFNEKYHDLDEGEMKFLKHLIEMKEDEKPVIMKSTLKECIKLVNNQLSECDVETKVKLLNVKERLLETEFNQDTFVEDYTKLKTLKDSLS